MINAPTYSPGEVVYLKESAALGFLEAVRISGVMYTQNGWLYTIQAKSGLPVSPSHFGDRRIAVHGATLYFSEDEFLTVCDAELLVEANLQAQLDRIKLQRSIQCPDATN